MAAASASMASTAVAALVASTVAARIVVILESKHPKTGMIYRHVSRVTATADCLHDIAEFHNTQKKQWASQETREGAPYWTVVAHTDLKTPFTRGSGKFSGYVQQLFDLMKSPSPKAAAAAAGTDDTSPKWLRDLAVATVAPISDTALLVECLRRVAKRYTIGVSVIA